MDISTQSSQQANGENQKSTRVARRPIAFESMVARFKQLSVNHTVPLQRIPSAAAFFGVQKLKLTFENA